MEVRAPTLRVAASPPSSVGKALTKTSREPHRTGRDRKIQGDRHA